MRFLPRRRTQRDIHDEFVFHESMAARAGRPAAPTDLWIEQARDLRRLRWLDDFGRDLRLALRRLRHAPGFTAVAIITLALGIGANTAIFTLVDAVMLRRLPVPHADQLVLVGAPDFDGLESGTAGGAVDGLTYQQVLQLRGQNHAFSGLAAFSAFEPSFQVDWAGAADTVVPLKFVSANYFNVLGLAPARGRWFDSGDVPEAVVSYEFWRTLPSILGRTLHLRDATFTVVGVAPPGFTGTTVGQAPALYVPIAMQPRIFPGSDWRNDPPGITRRMWLLALGRLRPGATLAQAHAEINIIFFESVRAQAALASNPADRRDLLTQYVPVGSAAMGVSSLRDEFAQPLWILTGLVALVLLVVIVNLGGMMLEQAAGRQREFALRLSLGAGRGRLMRQLLTESLLLAALGGLAGWWLAQWGGRLLVSLVAAGDASIALPLAADARVLAFTAAICLLSGIAFGLAPAMRLSRMNLAQRASQRTSRSAGPWLVVTQAAIAIVLVTGAALFLRSLGALRGVPLGYDAQHLESFNANVVMAGVSNQRALAIYDQVADATRLLPGVRAVTFSQNGLFTGADSADSITVPGYAGTDASARMDTVAPSYFAALGVPIRMGRAFTPEDRTRGVAPIVIDAVLAQRYFAGRNPIGQLITCHFSYGSFPFEVVGVSAKAVEGDLRSDPRHPRLYFDFGNDHGNGLGAVNYLVRVSSGAALTRPEVNAMLDRVTGSPVHVNRIGPATAALTATLAPDLLLVKLAGFFGVLALGLAVLGLYAMLSYALARRRPELAVRMALGARGSQVIAMVVRQALALLAIGIAIGAVGSVLLGRSLASLLYHVAPTDPASIAASALLLLAAGLAAALAPALRASRTDPARTLRAE